MYITSGELAKRFNVSIRTIRYYDQIGLVCPSKLGEGGKRFYSAEDCLILQKVILLKSLTLPLEEINRIIKNQSTESILKVHKSYLEEQVSNIQKSIAHTNSLLNILRLEGTINWEDLISLVVPSKQNRSWSSFFSADEQGKLRESLPKLEMDSPSIKMWINLIRRIELCIQDNISPGSEHAKLIIEDIEILSEETFQGDQNLMNKFWKVRRSQESSNELNLYPIKQEIIDFIEEAYAIIQGQQG
ncbi:transcriptional regulator [Halalkalibacter wakoensis JCM 9140]|uniref:Transcriptional regulator n=1 Tax=Halalkalibacter wakoensis JCM 9140 TaxID=1236970 RepID=W4Q6F8_9BACI|nr:MerR family transcriptional regulator [Halalkalibacter wakoensis]GAE26939.1 transcriptional regulator [Halalkalibacter wakoensis JCM 9140]